MPDASEEGGQLVVDKLFKGLTRPAMIFGVSFPFVFLNMMVSFLTYVNAHDIWILIIMLPSIHAVGYLICFKEPLFLELFILKTKKCPSCKNRMYHGANSYDVD